MDNSSPLSSCTYDKDKEKIVPYYSLFYEETINLIGSLKNKIIHRWLDVGCGTRELVLKASKRFPKTTFVITDPSKNMMDVAADKLNFLLPDKRLEVLSPTKTENLKVNKIEKLDVVTAIQTHHYTTGQPRKKAEVNCFELLKKGGVYISFENTAPDTASSVTIKQDYWKVYQALKGRSNEEIDNHMERYNSSYFPLNLDQRMQQLTDVGFKIVDVFWHTYIQCGIYAIK